MKKFLLLFIALALLTSCSNTSGSLTYDEIKRINEEETYPNALFSLVSVYEDMEELSASASAIISCHVTSSTVVDLDGLPQTHSTVQVDQVLMGAVSSQITIIEEGSSSAYWGVPPMEVGNHYVLFIVDSGLPQYQNSYCIAGAFQGKFIEREGYYFQQATESVKLSEDEYFPASFEALAKSLNQLTE